MRKNTSVRIIQQMCFLHMGLLPNHHVDDFLVGFFHADAAEAADVADRVLDAFEDEAVTAVELLAVSVHLKSHDAGIDGCGDFGSAERKVFLCCG